MKIVKLKISSAGGSTWNYMFHCFNDGDAREEMLNGFNPNYFDTDEAFEFFKNLIENSDLFAETTSVDLRFNGWSNGPLKISVDGGEAETVVIPPFEYMADINDPSTIKMPEGIPGSLKYNFESDLRYSYKIDALCENPLPDMGYVDFGCMTSEDFDEDYDEECAEEYDGDVEKSSDLGKVPGLLVATCYEGASEFEIELADDEEFDLSKLRLAACARVEEDTLLGAGCSKEYDLISADAIVYDGKWYPAVRQTGFCECPDVNIEGVELDSYDMDDEDEAEEAREISEVQRITYSTGDYYGDFPGGVKAWGVDVD